MKTLAVDYDVVLEPFPVITTEFESHGNNINSRYSSSNLKSNLYIAKHNPVNAQRIKRQFGIETLTEVASQEISDEPIITHGDDESETEAPVDIDATTYIVSIPAVDFEKNPGSGLETEIESVLSSSENPLIFRLLATDRKFLNFSFSILTSPW